MNASQLKRAQVIIDGIAACKNALSYESPAYNLANTLEMQKANEPGYSNPKVERFPMSRAVRDTAFRMMRREWEMRLADYRREAAQIGLNLDA